MDGMEAEMEPRPGWPLAVLGWEGGAARAARQVDVGQVKWAKFPSMREGTGRWGATWMLGWVWGCG